MTCENIDVNTTSVASISHAGQSMERSLRLAVVALGISHFEAPLFRLCARLEGLQIKVFYLQPVKDKIFDTDYGQVINWGSDLLQGYDSVQLPSVKELDLATKEWGADVVMLYGYGWPGAPWIIINNWLRRKPQIHRGTLNYYLDPRRPIKGRLLRPLGRLLLKLFDAHHYGGDYSRKVLLSAGANEAALFFVPYSVDTPYFLEMSEQPAQQQVAMELRSALGWDAGDHVLLFIAQHNWFKGPDIALEVFRKVAKNDPKARFLVVGSGSMTMRMKETAFQYFDSKKIHFAGFVPSAHTIGYYLASDLVLCTSRYETWARMVNEAMLCRRPCLVSRIVPAAGGLIINGTNGYIVDMLDAGEFALAIEKHFSLSQSERVRMGDAARDKAQAFAYEPYVHNVLAAAIYARDEVRRRCKLAF